jgi:hypothetical protein
VKSVALTAPATDFAVSGSPVTSIGTLNFAWKVAPTNTNKASAIVKRDASGNFSAGVITATDENLSDVLSITSTSANPLFVSTSATTGATAIYGVATSTTGTGTAFGVEGVTEGTSNTSYGVVGNAVATNGFPIGVYGITSSQTGVGVYAQNGTQSLTGLDYFNGNHGVGVWGDAGSVGLAAVVGTVDLGVGGYFLNNSASSPTVAAENKGATAASEVFLAIGPTGYCYFTGNGSLTCTGTINHIASLDGGARKVATLPSSPRRTGSRIRVKRR